MPQRPIQFQRGMSLSEFLERYGTEEHKARWLGAIAERRDRNIAKMAETLAKDPKPMNFHSALNDDRPVIHRWRNDVGGAPAHFHSVGQRLCLRCTGPCPILRLARRPRQGLVYFASAYM